MHNSAPANHHTSNKYFLLAFGLINILAFTLLFCTAGLLADAPVSIWQFPLAIICALLVNYYAVKFFNPGKSKLNFLKNSAAILTLVIGSIIVAGYFYDVSFDGQWYHQETVYKLKQGYNPAYQSLPVPADEQLATSANNWCMGTDRPAPNFIKSNTPPVNLKYLNINYFSKGTEFMAAAIYQCCGRIETGKAVNIILLLASFFLCLSLLYKIDKLGTGRKWLLAFVLAFNPIAVNELLSLCVDGNAACLLLCLLVIFCLLFIQQNRYYLLLLACLIAVTVNIKFTTLVFTGMYCFGFLIVLLVYKKIDTFKKVFIMGVIAAVVGIGCCGFSPYVTNTLQKHNVFYGLDETRDEIARLSPALFINHNRFTKLFFSLSAHQGWTTADKHSLSEIPKIPFTFNKNDITEANDIEQELSGFGPFFSGALLITIALFVIILIRFRKTQAFKQGGAALLIILSTILIMPDSWWLRFVPQFWLIPVIILLVAEFVSFRGGRLIKAALYLSLLLNIAWSALVIVSCLFTTARINYQMAQLKSLNKPVNLEFCNYRNFKSNLVRFNEAGIPVTQDNVAGKYAYDVVNSTTRFTTTAPLPELPKSFILKLSERVSGKK